MTDVDVSYNIFVGGCGSFPKSQETSLNVWEKCTFHKGRKIRNNVYNSEGGTAKIRWFIQNSPKIRICKENIFSVVDVIIFALFAR